MHKILKIKDMKRSKTTYAVILLYAAILASCTVSDHGLENQDKIEFQVKDNEAQSELGFYMTTASEEGSENLSGERIFDNVRFSYVNGRYICDPAIFYPEDTDTRYDLYVYSPYSENFIPQNTQSTTTVIPADQQEEAPADLRFASTRNFSHISGTPSLELEHAYSKINIKLAPGGYYENIEEIPSDITITLKGFANQAKINLAEQTVETTGEECDITPYGTFKRDGSVLSGVSAIIPPQSVKNGETIMDIMAGDDHFIVKTPKDLDFLSGTENTLTIKLNADFAGTILLTELTVEPWQDGEDINMDEDEILPPQENTVKDYDGNSYEIIKIGKQFWMASNLRVTHLNDGTPLTKCTEIIKWKEYTKEGAYVSYEFKESEIDKYGYLYNRYSVESDKLCPEGWHVPSTTDWDKLAGTLGGTIDDYHSWLGIGNMMKSESGWTGNGNGDNSSKFNAYPAGYLSAIEDEEGIDRSNFWEKGETTRFWSYTGFTGAMSFSRTLYAEDEENAMKRVLTQNTNGLSVRCVHDF